ncbi:MAG: 3-dehydroquinate synthase [Eubacteriales bacterium]|jgi:3-dehydroquinate synthase
MNEYKTVRVASGGYDVLIGRGLLYDAGRLISSCHPVCKILIVTDDNVAPLWLDRVVSSLCAAGFETETAILPHGEGSKSLGCYGRLLERCAEAGLTRGDMIAALGGGVIGDIAGFAAATYMRGIDYVQLPTTLLAAVDSSVGGKTAIDIKAGKNLCGAFHQPRLVICDLDAFSTLPDEVLSDGAAEVIKYGAIADRELFSAMLKGKPDFDAEYVVETCVRIKADIVDRDLYDRRERRLLNFGHTVGHAIEKLSGFKIPHGHSVAAGMVYETAAAAARNLCHENIVIKTAEANKAWGLPVNSDFTAAELADAAMLDKKIDGGRLALIIPKSDGLAEIREIETADFAAYLKAGEMLLSGVV